MPAQFPPAIGPAAHDRLLQLQCGDDRVYVICPVLAIFKCFWIAQFVGEAMSADIHSHQVKLLCQVALKLLVPRQTALTVRMKPENGRPARSPISSTNNLAPPAP